MYKICVVVPCYNEENRLQQKAFIEFAKQNPQYTFCFVNDGSSDNTLHILNKIHQDLNNQSFVVDLEQNQGKAEAIRQGFLAMQDKDFDYIAFLDADLATPLDELLEFEKILTKNSTVKAILGSRVNLLGRNIKRSKRRHYIGRVFATVVSNMLSLAIYDTQCGAKCFHQSITKHLFKTPFVTKWLFDIEIIFRMKQIFSKQDFKKYVHEYPLMNWEEKSGSKLSLLNFLSAPIDLLKIYFKYK